MGNRTGGRMMIEALSSRVKRKLRQIFCFRHKWRVWVDGTHKQCMKCDKTVRGVVK